MEDLALLTAWRDGDKRAGAELVSRYFAPLMRLFRNKVNNPDDAKELVGETMLATTKGKANIVGDDFRKYVFGIAMNKLREHYRKRVKRNREEADFSELCAADLETPSSPATVVSRKREVQLLARALRRLPLQQQIVLELNFFEGEKPPRIAEFLDLPVQTVYTRLRRGKERLGELMHALGEEPEVVTSTLMGLNTWASHIRDQWNASA